METPEKEELEKFKSKERERQAFNRFNVACRDSGIPKIYFNAVDVHFDDDDIAFTLNMIEHPLAIVIAKVSIIKALYERLGRYFQEIENGNSP